MSFTFSLVSLPMVALRVPMYAASSVTSSGRSSRKSYRVFDFKDLVSFSVRWSETCDALLIRFPSTYDAV